MNSVVNLQQRQNKGVYFSKNQKNSTMHNEVDIQEYLMKDRPKCLVSFEKEMYDSSLQRKKKDVS